MLFKGLLKVYLIFRYEQKRRAKIQKLKYFIKILYNDKQVSCTSVSPLQFDFKCLKNLFFLVRWFYCHHVIRKADEEIKLSLNEVAFESI